MSAVVRGHRRSARRRPRDRERLRRDGTVIVVDLDPSADVVGDAGADDVLERAVALASAARS